MKKYIYIFILFLILNILIFFLPQNNMIKNFVFEIKEYTGEMLVTVGEFFENNKDKKTLSKENKELNKENEEQTELIEKFQIENSLLKEKLKDLEEKVEIYDNNEDKIIIAKVLAYKINPNLNIIEINKGSKDNIKIKQLVTNNEQIIGYVTKVNQKSSEVLLLNNTNVKYNIPINIQRNDKIVQGIIKEYNKETKSLIIEPLYLEKLNVGDQIFIGSSKLGKITKIEEINNTQNKYMVNYKINKLDYVEVTTYEK